METKGTHTNNVILQYSYCGIYTEPGSLVFDLAKFRLNRPSAFIGDSNLLLIHNRHFQSLHE